MGPSQPTATWWRERGSQSKGHHPFLRFMRPLVDGFPVSMDWGLQSFFPGYTEEEDPLPWPLLKGGARGQTSFKIQTGGQIDAAEAGTQAGPR